MLVFRQTESNYQSRIVDDDNGGERSRFHRVAPTKKNVDFECILTIAGVKYDLTSWARAHPGGSAILKKYNGLDATNAFQRVGHSSHAYKQMSSFALSNNDKLTSAERVLFSEKKLLLEQNLGGWKKKVFTKEDKNNVHKICGLFVLAHFGFRYQQMLFGDVSAGFGSCMGKGKSFSAIICLIPHMILSLSSLIFHSVPKERIVGQPMIWQEFRVHSIIFTMRSLISTLCAWTSFYFEHDLMIRRIAIFVSSLTILMVIYLADIATKKLCPSKNESTTATMPYWEDCSVATQHRFKLFYAYCQFLATLACLIMSNPAWPFAVMLPIQLAAFLMTMVRKGFLSAKGYHMIYSASLVMPYIVAIRGMFYTRSLQVIGIFVLGCLLFRLRCAGVGKYYLWVPIVVMRILIGDEFLTYDVW